MGVLKRIEKRKYRKIRKAVKSYRGRFWKNLAIFMAGVFSSGFIFIGAVAIVLSAIPISTLTGDNTDKIVSEQLADQSILNVLLGLKDYTTDDIIAVNTIIDAIQNAEVGGKKLNQFVTIDTSKFAGVKVFELGSVIKDAIKVTATVENTVGMDMLNELGLGKISALTEFEKVLSEDGETQKNAGEIDVTAEDFKAKLYYYLAGEGVYERAYKDDGSFADGVTAETPVYYGALTKIPITDAALLMNDVTGRIKAVDLLSAFGISSEGVLGNIIGDKTLTQLGELNADSICIYDILGGEESDDLYKILSDATGKPYNEILASDLTSLDINKIKVSTAFNNATPAIKDVFVDLINAEKEEGVPDKTWEGITIADLQGINEFTNIKLSTVMSDTYPTGYVKEDETTVTKGSLIADILLQANNMSVQDWDTLTVSDIKSITNFNDVSLSLVLENPGSLGTILEDITETPYSEIKVSSLNGLSVDGLHLSSVMTSVTSDSTIAKVLVQATEASSWNDITVSQLTGSGFNFSKVELETVMNGSLDAKMEGVLREAFEKEEGALTVGDLSGGFELNNIKLKTLGIEAGDNKILAALLADEDVTINGLGDKINSLKIYDIYGAECFTKNVGDSVDSTTKFRFEEELYVEDENGTYYKTAGGDYVKDKELAVDANIKYRRCKGYVHDNVNGDYYLHANDGMWLLLCFDSIEMDANTGRPEIYAISDVSFNDLTSGTSISSRFENATIAQLVDAGMLSVQREIAGQPNPILKYSLTYVLNNMIVPH